jgi:hypothetical protein
MTTFKRLLLWLLLLLSMIVLFYNTINLFELGTSLKFEVEHPRMMKGNDKDILSRESELNNLIMYCQLIYVYSIVAIIASIFGLKQPIKK